MAQSDNMFAKGMVVFPFGDWDERPASLFGWSEARLATLSAELEKGESSAFMIVQGGRMI